jgi:hypothetical protein
MACSHWQERLRPSRLRFWVRMIDVTERIRTCLYLLDSDSANSRPSPPLHFERCLQRVLSIFILQMDEKLTELVRKCEELYDMGNKK